MIQAIHWRRFSLVALGAGVGAAGAWLARQAVAINLPLDQLPTLVWIVISVPLGSFVGAVLGKPQGWVRAGGWVGLIYFFSVFAAARLERLLLGNDAAAANAHLLYFTLAIVLQIIGCLIFAHAWAAVDRTTEGVHPQDHQR